MDVQAELFFPVIGVGASAGGLDAFKELVAAIPTDSGMAYILVQHLSPDHESILTEILRKTATIPVMEIKTGMQVSPDHIYVIPSNQLLTLKDDILQLDPINRNDKLNSIDVFFCSMAESHQQHSFGILLSGTGTDGTIGLKTIKDQGGTTMVQDEGSAAYFAMAKSAIDADVVDFVLAPALMPSRIREILAATGTGLSLSAGEESNEKEYFRRILALVKAKRGVDFTYYKQSTIHRRILRRKALTGKENLKSYADLLFDSKAEQEALFKDILIPVTAFFRDTGSFALLTKEILPGLFKNSPPTDAKRIWVAGCSTGEEAYSIAICLQEYFNESMESGTVQIFATDISETSISKARSGIYSKQDMAGVSEERLNRFFSKIDGTYQVSKSIREMCVFATQNFLQDPPFAKIDLVSCRNVLIYLEPYLQKRALTTFHYALKANGVLFLGRSESVGLLSTQFILINHHDKFYRRNTALGRFVAPVSAKSVTTENPASENIRQADIRRDDFQRAADEALLEKYAAVGVLVNEQMDVVQFRGSTGAFLEQPPGKATHNVLKMAREGLAFELRNALSKAKDSHAPVKKESVTVARGEKSVNIEVIPLKNTLEVYYLILFTENTAIDSPANTGNKKDSADKKSVRDLQQKRISSLEQDLALAREDMRAITENQEAANEELQSANEELLSGSEELQTLNEELETSKEEIQSSNEELTILNQELIDRNEQLIQARKYAEAVVSTLHEPLIILSSDFRIRTANKCFYDTFGSNERLTEGRPFFEWNEGMWNVPQLRSALEVILPHKSHFEDLPVHISRKDSGADYELNARQIINETSNEQLILLAMQDVTDRKLLQSAQESFARDLEVKIREQTLELLELNAGLKLSNDSLKQFNSIASHDLQEPLRKIRTFTVMLTKSFHRSSPEESQVLIGKIASSVERMSQLIKDVLEFSKIEKADRKFEVVNLNKILDSVLADLDLLIEESGAVVRISPALPEIQAIPLQMRQLFHNLLVNAVKFRKSALKAVITLSSRLMGSVAADAATALPDAARAIEIIVEDNGIGFEQQFAGQIFDLFERLHSSDEFAGTGVGLALCKRVVENHHGIIYAKSEENAGARFFIILPLKQHS